MNITITNLQIATLSSIVTETEVKRPASKDAAIKRFTTVLVEKIGERANDLIETILEAETFEDAQAKLIASFAEPVVEEVVEVVPVEVTPVVVGQETPVVDQPAESVVRKHRSANYTFEAKETSRLPKDDSLRAKCVTLLTVGGTIEQVQQLIIDNDLFTHGSAQENVQRRARKLVRTMNKSLGFGVHQDPETGVITIK